MKVILQKDIPNLGDAGDIKEVANGYARNYLLPRNLVLVASESKTKAFEHQQRLIKLKKEKRKKASEQLAEKLQNVQINIKAKVGEEEKLFGSITAMDIAKELKAQGFDIDKRKVILENPIKQLGEHSISIKLDEGMTPSIKVIVEQE